MDTIKKNITTQEYVKQIRDLTGFSDYKIAQYYGINQSNFSKYSSGKATLSETHAFLFANILQINPSKILIDVKLEGAIKKKDAKRVKFWHNQLNNLKPIDNKPLITIAQFNPTVGDIKHNSDKIIKQSLSASSQSDLIIFPELAICGYHPEDLMLHNNFMQELNNNLQKIIDISDKITIILGAPIEENGKLYNGAYLLKNKKIIGSYYKRKLPNYGIFDEKRYFSAGNTPFVFMLKGVIFSIIICEDTWSHNVIKSNKELGVNTIISINASPFSIDKHKLRLSQILQLSKQYNINFIYVNSVGSQDGIVFDGGSFAVENNEEDIYKNITHQLPFFDEKFHNLTKDINNKTSTIEIIYQALVIGLKEYFIKNNSFNGIIIATSGGIDSALTLAIAADAIGNKNIKAIMMPYKYTSNKSLLDSRDQVNRMNIDYQELDITPMVKSFNDALDANFLFNKNDNSITKENIQARVRGILAMAIANQENRLLLTTGNKSEMAVGYATLYGDMAGGYAPIKDVYKTLVYKLANYRNTIKQIIPENIITKEPSAELAENQLDTDSLPPYDVLDKILKLFIEDKKSKQEITQQGFDKNIVDKILKMIINAEHKRQQSPIGTKITNQSFNKDRRYPIINKFKF